MTRAQAGIVLFVALLACTVSACTSVSVDRCDANVQVQVYVQGACR